MNNPLWISVKYYIINWTFIRNSDIHWRANPLSKHVSGDLSLFSRLKLLTVFLRSSEILPERGSLFAHGPTVTGVRRVATLSLLFKFASLKGWSLPATMAHLPEPKIGSLLAHTHRTNYLTMGSLHGLVTPVASTRTTGVVLVYILTQCFLCHHALLSRGPLVLLLEGSSSRVHPWTI